MKIQIHTHTHTHTHTYMFIMALLIITKSWGVGGGMKRSWSSGNNSNILQRWVDKPAVVHPENGTLLSHKKEWSTDMLQSGWNLKTQCLLRKARLWRPLIVWFCLQNILEKIKLKWQRTDKEFTVVNGEGIKYVAVKRKPKGLLQWSSG